MSDYKTEVVRTEQLKIDIENDIINIFNELAKDDNISRSNRISNIIEGIQKIKGVRKRFAFGENATINVEQEYKESTDFYVGSFNLSVNFNPSFVIAMCENVRVPLIYKKDNQGYFRIYVAYNYWRYSSDNHIRASILYVENDEIYNLSPSDGATDISTTSAIFKNKVKLEMADRKFEVFLSKLNPSNLAEGIEKGIKKVKYWAAFE